MLIATAASGASAMAACKDNLTLIWPPINNGTNCPSISYPALGYEGTLANCPGIINASWTGSNPALSKVGHYTLQNTGEADLRVFFEINNSYKNGVVGYWLELAAGTACEGDTFSDNQIGKLNYQTM